MTESLDLSSNYQSSAEIEIPESIFRAYDIRGVVDEQLTGESVRHISRAIGFEAKDNGINTLYVGFDGRLSSPALSQELIEGLRDAGCSVVSLGMIPTPLLYFATHTTDIDSGVMLTASHNPSNYNGLKIVFNKSCLADDQIQKVRRRVESGDYTSGSGNFSSIEINDTYIADVCDRISLTKPLKVVVDCGNAVPSNIAPELFERMGCEVLPLFCEIDGSFPNHHPDPTVSVNLEDLRAAVVAEKADIGVAFDGDGDRLGIVTNLGDEISADKMLMLLTQEIAPFYTGESIVFDVKCSRSLAELISGCGMVPVMHRSGHSFMKQKMQETNAPLGGEFAAHIFLKDGWFGFDDGIYTAARIFEILSRRQESVSEVFANFQVPFSTQEIKVSVPEEKKFDLIKQIVSSADFPEGHSIVLDGLRVEFDKGWGLIRASNTSPALLLRFEADTAEYLEQLKDRFRSLIQTVDNSINLDF